MMTQSDHRPRWRLMQDALMRHPEAVVPATIRLWVFLIGAYPTQEEQSSPMVTVADGIVWRSQQLDRNAMARKLPVVQRPGLPTFRSNGDRVEVSARAIYKSDTTAAAELTGDQYLGKCGVIGAVEKSPDCRASRC